MLHFCYLMNRHALKLDELGLEIARISLPAALALTADPVASLVDTAFIGRIGIAFSLFLLSLLVVSFFSFYPS